jgi:hypothetical protein
MISFITTADLDLVKRLDANQYQNLSMKGVVSQREKSEFFELRKRLRNMSDFFKNRYDQPYGDFLSESATGNPVDRGGKLRRVWSGVFKGSEKKQYSAQVSFVINTARDCLDVGVYFGRAASLGLEKKEREKYEKELQQIGSLLAEAISGEEKLRRRYYGLFELGFRAEIRNEVVTPERWLRNALEDPGYSSVTIGILPNSLGYIDTSAIDFYVSMVMPLMSVIPERITDLTTRRVKRKIPALTPEQRAKKAERLSQIGQAGEEFILEQEKIRLTAANIIKPDYPYHKALESDNEGYDILSRGPEGDDLYIEVKTTTMPRGHAWAKTFFISKNEYDFYKANKSRYKLYRVWNIYDQPTFEEIDLEAVRLETDGYRAIIPED